MIETAFSSIVQYQPDAARQEAANVGLVLFAPGIGRLDVRMAAGLGHVQRFFGKQIEAEFLADMKRAFEGRLRAEAKSIHSEQELEAFANRLGNEIKMTEPRGVAISPTFDSVFDDLFNRLVAEPKSEPTRRSALGRRLRTFFDRLPNQEAIYRNRKVELPEIEAIEAPYAYLNGTLNLVKPISLGDKAKDEARSWLLVDQILRKNASNFEREPKIEVVLAKADDSREEEQRAYCEKVLARSGVKLFSEERLEEFQHHVLAGLKHERSL